MGCARGGEGETEGGWLAVFLSSFLWPATYSPLPNLLYQPIHSVNPGWEEVYKRRLVGNLLTSLWKVGQEVRVPILVSVSTVKTQGSGSNRMYG